MAQYSDLFNRPPNTGQPNMGTAYTYTDSKREAVCHHCKHSIAPGIMHRCLPLQNIQTKPTLQTNQTQYVSPAYSRQPAYSNSTMRDISYNRTTLISSPKRTLSSSPSRSVAQPHFDYSNNFRQLSPQANPSYSTEITPKKDAEPTALQTQEISHKTDLQNTTNSENRGSRIVVITTEVLLPGPESVDLRPQSKVLSVSLREDDKIRTFDNSTTTRNLVEEDEEWQMNKRKKEREMLELEKAMEERRLWEWEERERQRDIERMERDRQREINWERETETKLRLHLEKEQQLLQGETVLAPSSLSTKKSNESIIGSVQHQPQSVEASARDLYLTENAKKTEKKQNTGKMPTIDLLAQMIERKDLKILESFGGVENLCSNLDSDLQVGLSKKQAELAETKFGKNELPKGEKVTFFGLIKDAFGDTMMCLLIGAAIVSIIFGVFKQDEFGNYNFETGWIEGSAILTSVFVVVFVSAINDYKKAKKFEEMNAKQAKKSVEVIRDGCKHILDSAEVVVGDVVLVTAGQTLVVDGVLIEGQDLKVDESACTGESDIIKKGLGKDQFFLSGTNVTEGEGRMLVVGVGTNSFAGKLAMATRGAPVETPLQVKLANLAELIGKAGLFVAILTFAVLCFKQLIKNLYFNDEQATLSPGVFLKFMLVSITMVVVAIPEGLPLAVTIALAYSMKSMLKDNCLVRILAACETMGGANAVCSDKTGTLTTNRMTVVQGWLAEDNFVFGGYGVQGGENSTELPHSQKTVKLPMQTTIVDLLCKSIAFNSTADEQSTGIWSGGNKTEYGLLGFVDRIGGKYKQIRAGISRENQRTYPFSSAKKRSTTIVNEGNMQFIHVKGASEMVLADCTEYMTRNGTTKPLGTNEKDYISSVIMQMATQGNRTIAVAYATAPLAAFPEEEPQPSLNLIGIVGLQDPIRTEVPEAINRCRQAGIVVRMVTGDNMHTAIAIAKKCGLLAEGEVREGTAMEGKTFRAMAAEDPIKLLKLIPDLRVLARSSPTDKLVLVSCLMDEGDIVAVTGDGTNDAPALKLADVGFAMKTGTEVATGASDMVLLDDNFASVVKACIWGRTVNDNIRKFLQFQLTVNVAGVLLTLIGAALNEHNEEPLKPVQMLWLNLIMDTLAALALATEKPTLDCLNRLPFYRSSPLLSKRMLAFITIHGIFQLSVQLYLLFKGHDLFNVGPCVEGIDDPSLESVPNCQNGIVHSTIIFNVFIWLQLINELNARKLYGEKNIFGGLGRSPLFILIWLACAAFQIVAVEFGNRFMHTHHLNWEQWKLCIFIALLEIPVGFIVNMLPIKAWRPGPNTNNKADLDTKKREAIRQAKISAGMIPEEAIQHLTNVFAKKRWNKATKAISLQTKTLKAIQQQRILKHKDVTQVWDIRPAVPLKRTTTSKFNSSFSS